MRTPDPCASECAKLLEYSHHNQDTSGCTRHRQEILCRLRNDSGCLQPIFNPHPAFWRSLALRYPYCDAEHDLGRGAEYELNLGSSPDGFWCFSRWFWCFSRWFLWFHEIHDARALFPCICHGLSSCTCLESGWWKCKCW